MNRTRTTRLSHLAPLFALPLACALLVGCGKKDETPPPATPAEGSSSQLPSAPPPMEGSAPRPAAAPVANPEAEVVSVNGKTLTQGDVSMQVQRLMGSPQARQIPPQMRAQYEQQASQQVVQNFVVRTLLAGEAEKQKVEVDPTEREEALNDLKSRLPEGMTIADAAAQVGSTVEELESELSDQLRVQKMVEKKFETLEKPTDEAIAAFYAEKPEQFEMPETVNARHILVKVEADEDEAARAAKKSTAEGYRKLIVDGADFAAVASEHSACPSSAKGGDLGSFGRNQMAKPFEEAAFTQDVGTLGPVIETQFGYHIVEVTERSEARTEPLEKVKDFIAEHLEQQQRRAFMDTYIGELREAATINYAQN